MNSTARRAPPIFSALSLPTPSKPRICSKIVRSSSSSRSNGLLKRTVSTRVSPRLLRSNGVVQVRSDFDVSGEPVESPNLYTSADNEKVSFRIQEVPSGSSVSAVKTAVRSTESDDLLIIAPDGAEVSSSEIKRSRGTSPSSDNVEGNKSTEESTSVLYVNEKLGLQKPFEVEQGENLATGPDVDGIRITGLNTSSTEFDIRHIRRISKELPFKLLEKRPSPPSKEVLSPPSGTPEVEEGTGSKTVPDDRDENEKSLGAEIREISALAGPALGSVIADPLMSLIDTGCVGQQCSLELAALGPNTAIFNLVFQVFAFIGVATTNVIASKLPSAPGLSEEEREARKLETGKLMSNAFTLAMVSGVLCCIVMETIPEALLVTMGASPEMMAPALTYLKIRAFASPAVMVMCAAQGACLGQQDAWTPLKIFCAAGIVNLVLDIYLITFAGYGIAGAAWATLFAQYLGASAFMAVLYRRGRKNGIRLGWAGLPSWASFQPYIAMASALAPGAIVRMTGYAILTCKATYIGTTASAAHQVGLQVFRFLAFIPEPLSITAQSLIARDFEKRERVRRLAKTLLASGVSAGCGLGVVVVGIFAYLPWLFTSDPMVVAAIQEVCPQAFFAIITLATIMVMDGIAIGAGDFAYLPRTSMLATAGCWLGAQYCTGIGSVWWTLLVFFGLRLMYHFGHVVQRWDDHPLGNFKVKLC